MIQRGQRSGFATESFCKRRLVASSGRQNLEGDNSPQLFLPRLIYRSHAAPPNKFEDFQLRKIFGQCFGISRDKFRLYWSRRGLAVCLRLAAQASLHQALRTKSFRGINWQWSTTCFAESHCFHRPFSFLAFSIHPLQKKNAWKVTGFFDCQERSGWRWKSIKSSKTKIALQSRTSGAARPLWPANSV